MADHQPTDDDRYKCKCGNDRVPDGEGGTVCVSEDFSDHWPEWEMPDDAPTNDDVAALRAE